MDNEELREDVPNSNKFNILTFISKLPPFHLFMMMLIFAAAFLFYPTYGIKIFLYATLLIVFMILFAIKNENITERITEAQAKKIVKEAVEHKIKFTDELESGSIFIPGLESITRFHDGKAWYWEIPFKILDPDDIEKQYTCGVNIYTGEIRHFKYLPKGFSHRHAPDVRYIKPDIAQAQRMLDMYMEPSIKKDKS